MPGAGRAGEATAGAAGRRGAVSAGLPIPAIGPLPCVPDAPVREPLFILAPLPDEDASGAAGRTGTDRAEPTTIDGPPRADMGGRRRAADDAWEGFARAAGRRTRCRARRDTLRRAGL